MKYLTLLLVFTSVLYSRSHAQYQVVGNAAALAPDTFLLTPDVTWQNGAVWHTLKHDFTTPFSIAGRIFFGDADGGADGIVFVIQNKCMTIGGAAGGGIGYQNFPGYSLGVEFDTYQNAGAPINDPSYDHLAVFRDGSADHAVNLAGPVQIDAGSANVEDNSWHSFQIDYNPATTTLNVYFGGNCASPATSIFQLPYCTGKTTPTGASPRRPAARARTTGLPFHPSMRCH